MNVNFIKRIRKEKFMYEIKSKDITLAKENLTVFSRVIDKDNALEVEVGTNGHHSDEYHTRTYFRLTNIAGTCFDCIKQGEDTVELIFYGNSELDTFIKALEFALRALKEQKNGRDE